MKKARKITGILVLCTLFLALVYMAFGIFSILSSPMTSFPWWAACWLTALYFGPFLAVELIAYLVFKAISRNIIHKER